MSDTSSERAALLAALVASGTERHLSAGEQVCSEGDESTSAFAVVSGMLEATVAGHGGEMVVAEHGSGSLVGEITSLIGGHRTATLRAKAATVVVVVDREQLIASFDLHPIAAEQLLRAARERTDRSRVAALLSHELQAPDGEAVAAIAERVTWVQVGAGETLFEAGDDADAAYLVVGGRLGVFVRDAEPRAAIDPSDGAPDGPDRDTFGDVRDHVHRDGAMIEVGRGGIVGEFGLLENRTRNATVVALRDTSLARLSADDFRSISADHTALAMGLVRRILDRSGADHSATATTRTLTIAVAGDASPDAVDSMVDAMAAALDRFGPTVVLDADRVDTLLKQPGIAETPAGSFGEVRLAELLHQMETDADHVILVAGHDRLDGSWAARCLHHTDQVVVVSSDDPDEAEATRIDRVLASIHERIPVWLAVRHRATTIAPGSTRARRERFRVGEVHHLRSGNDADVARLGRLAGGRGLGLVLSGGGARGHAHIGVYRALVEAGVAVDRVVGASMGSIVAGGIGQDLAPDTLLDDMQNGADRLLDYTVPIVSLIKGERIVGVLEHQFGDTEIDDLPIPFACVSTDLTTAEVVVHRSGRVATMIRTSVAIPGVLPPVVHGDHLLADGGILDNLPVGVLSADPSIGTIIASDVAPSLGPSAKGDYGLSVSGWAAMRDKALPRRLRRGAPDVQLPGIGATLMRSLLIGSSKSRDEHLATGRVDLYLDLDLRGIALLDFAQVIPAAQRGYESGGPMITDWLARTAGGARRSPFVSTDDSSDRSNAVPNDGSQTCS